MATSEAALPAILPEFLRQQNIWKRRALSYFILNFALGGLSVLLCSLYAANTRMEANAKFLTPMETTVFGVAAALLTFFVTAAKPSTRYAGYSAAERELEKAIAEFQADFGLTYKHLSSVAWTS